jgi:SpoVK/Ycf46/Vps4 family AAA+-type ATPase
MGEIMASTFEITVCNLLKARFPLIYIPTWEEDRVVSVITKIVSDPALIKTTRKIFVWTLTDGMKCEGKCSAKETKAAIKALDIIDECDEPALFILKDFHPFFGVNNRPPDFQVIRRIRDLVTILKEAPKPKSIIFISPSLVLPNDLQKDVTVVEFDFPHLEEIRSLLDEMIAANRESGRIAIEVVEKDCERLAKAALGLTLQEAENAFARAMVEDGRLDVSDIDIILDEKRQIIKKTQILEFIESDLMIEDVGGLENLKRWLTKRNKSWLDDAKVYCLPAPKGVLITGVPGCGKSLTSKAISAMWQLPLLRLDIGRIFGGLVGQSEENIRLAIRTAEAIAPSILWIDEIEKGFSGSGSSGDSGTSSRVFGTFLTWMQEKTKPVFVIATANNIHALPPEMLRKGRFDEIFFVDLPTRMERHVIFELHIKKRLKDPRVIGDFSMGDKVFEELAILTEGFVGAEIEHIVVAALFEAFSEDRSITMEDFKTAIRNTVPLSVTQAEQINTLREWANKRAVAATRKVDRDEYKLDVVTSEDDVSSSRGGRAIDF